ncbi:MAG: hypothetical protein JW776_15330 [Candidatus Lokiarchaeota archaeon]|nr:hypothetical protein [Candidatus Lokiarchaeota archaeon]
MESNKIKVASYLIISIILIGVISNISFVNASSPKSAQGDSANLDVDGHDLNIDGTTNTVGSDEVNIVMNPMEMEAQMDILTDQGNQYLLFALNTGGLFLGDGMGWTTGAYADPVSNTTHMALAEFGSIYTDLTTNVHTIEDIAGNYNAELNMENGDFLFNDTSNEDTTLRVVIIPGVEILLFFTDNPGYLIEIFIDGTITIDEGVTIVFTPGEEGDKTVYPVIGGINVTRFHDTTIIQYFNMKFVLHNYFNGVLWVGIGEIFFGNHHIQIVDIWNWFLTGYLIYGWFSPIYGWIWIEFYLHWWYYELIYVLVWEIYGYKIEVYYLEIELIYFVVTWSSLTVFIWWYEFAIVWEFKFIYLFWIFHWQITWHIINLTWFWWFNVYYIYWSLPVVILYVPILYIPPIVDIDVYCEIYDVDNKTLQLDYILTDLYGQPILGADVDVTVKGTTYSMNEIGGGQYQKIIFDLENTEAFNIRVNATVPGVALIEELEYVLNCLTSECPACPECPPSSTIPGYHLIPLILISAAAVISVVLVIRKKLHIT